MTRKNEKKHTTGSSERASRQQHFPGVELPGVVEIARRRCKRAEGERIADDHEGDRGCIALVGRGRVSAEVMASLLESRRQLRHADHSVASSVPLAQASDEILGDSEAAAIEERCGLQQARLVMLPLVGP